MSNLNIWIELISEAFGDADIIATDEQIKLVADTVNGLQENWGLVTGSDVASSNFISDDKRELDNLKKEISESEKWIKNSSPCSICHTSGLQIDTWGRPYTCDICDGNGRVRN
jgi:hypothetical protein